MDKRYQVFVSSTYVDLKEERQRVIQTLMEMDCIPAGMELFPAADEEQWEFIKKVINDCDYYLLIIGGRYGSLSEEGISYTEMEFDYAVGIGLRVIALVHGDPKSIPFGKTDASEELQAKLSAFREKVTTDRLVRFWEAEADLPGLVALSLSKTIKAYPSEGWVRANKIATDSVLNDLAKLNQENKTLREKVSKASKVESTPIQDIADISETFMFRVNYMTSGSAHSHSRSSHFLTEMSWEKIFMHIGPYLEEHPAEFRVSSTLGEIARKLDRITGRSGEIEKYDLKTIGVQLEAYGLVVRKYSKSTKGGMGYFWSLSLAGKEKMKRLRVVKKSESK